MPGPRSETRRFVVGLALVVALFAAVFGGCRRKGGDLAFGARCGSDNDCRSGICLFQSRAAPRGTCTRPCELDENDCPEGTSCATIAEHAGASVPVCGEPPPIPLGPGGTPGAGPVPPPSAGRGGI